MQVAGNCFDKIKMICVICAICVQNLFSGALRPLRGSMFVEKFVFYKPLTPFGVTQIGACGGNAVFNRIFEDALPFGGYKPPHPAVRSSGISAIFFGYVLQ